MNKYDVAIIGGGISGLSAGLILSAGIKDNNEIRDKSVCVFDAGGSDALKAQFFNAPGIKQGTSGKKAIKKLREQVESYRIVDFYDNRVREIRKISDGYTIATKKGAVANAEYIILATGFRNWDINGLEIPIKPFTRTTNPSRVAVEHRDYRIDDKIYVCGLLADVSSHYPIVAGTGAQAAINLMHEWTGEWIVIHDK